MSLRVIINIIPVHVTEIPINLRPVLSFSDVCPVGRIGARYESEVVCSTIVTSAFEADKVAAGGHGPDGELTAASWPPDLAPGAPVGRDAGEADAGVVDASATATHVGAGVAADNAIPLATFSEVERDVDRGSGGHEAEEDDGELHLDFPRVGVGD